MSTVPRSRQWSGTPPGAWGTGHRRKWMPEGSLDHRCQEVLGLGPGTWSLAWPKSMGPEGSRFRHTGPELPDAGTADRVRSPAQGCSVGPPDPDSDLVSVGFLCRSQAWLWVCCLTPRSRGALATRCWKGHQSGLMGERGVLLACQCTAPPSALLHVPCPHVCAHLCSAM